jgi:hypothetical protein
LLRGTYGEAIKSNARSAQPSRIPNDPSNVYVWSAHDGAGNTVDGELANLGPDFGWHYREIINDHVVVNSYCNE